MNNVLKIAQRLVDAADQTFSCSELRKRRYAEDTARGWLRDLGQEDRLPEVLEALAQIYRNRAAASLVNRDCLKYVGEGLSRLHRRRKVVFSGRVLPVVSLSVGPRLRRQDKNLNLEAAPAR